MSAREVKLDFERAQRIGLGEGILCAGKSTAQLATILDQARSLSVSFLLTRLAPAAFADLPQADRAAIDYDPVSRTGFFGDPAPVIGPARTGIVVAGTSDVPVSREAARTLRFHGETALEITDVGVAGLWRLMERVEECRKLPVVIAVAGMDAALVSVLGGLLPNVIIAVPTSTGYGVARGGETALHASLASCAPGIAVVNIDNGYGAACAALRVLRMASSLCGPAEDIQDKGGRD